MSTKKYLIGNWKMNNLSAEVKSFAENLNQNLLEVPNDFECWIAPAYIYINELRELVNKNLIKVGSQNIHWLDKGAHTGEISPLMLKEIGGEFAIIGHSERRQFYGETNQFVKDRAKAALAHGLSAVLCVGETREEYEKGITIEVLREQLVQSLSRDLPNLDKLIIAYEPVWAIGTGLVPTLEIISTVHNEIRAILNEIFAKETTFPILYGGSVTPDNVADILKCSNVSGALVGGASVKADSYISLIKNAACSK